MTLANPTSSRFLTKACNLMISKETVIKILSCLQTLPNQLSEWWIILLQMVLETMVLIIESHILILIWSLGRWNHSIRGMYVLARSSSAISIRWIQLMLKPQEQFHSLEIPRSNYFLKKLTCTTHSRILMKSGQRNIIWMRVTHQINILPLSNQ
jgi:hypothetical protein